MANNEIRYLNYVFSDVDESLRNGNVFAAVSLPVNELQADTIELEVKCADPAIVKFQRNTPLEYYYRGSKKGTYYVQSIDRIGPEWYTIQADSAMGLLMQMEHYGGIYTGQTAEEIIKSICGPVPVIVKSSFASVKLYGWLPYVKPPNSSTRDNLAQVLFAIGANVRTDLNGVLRVENLWDGISGQIGENRMFLDGSVVYGAEVSAVNVTEHSYFPGTEEKSLFEGTTVTGDIITFDEPMHSLTADGFSILESGDNYAKVSAGSGTLRGKVYIHNTRQIVETVTPDTAPNVKSVEDATLVSLTNSSAVAKRLAAYYRCTESIQNGIVTGAEAPGDVVSIYHPYDKKTVSACIVNASLSMSGTLKSDLTALVGFKPVQFTEQSFYDKRVVLTGTGEFEVPEGVTNVRYALFSGAQGGMAGSEGGTAGGSRTHNYSHTSWITGKVNQQGIVKFWGGPGGKGGLGGPGGKGSKILEGVKTVTPGQRIPYSCGIGGIGADYNAETPTNGAEGTETTFGDQSSSNGSYSADTGWVDAITGEVFAKSGLDGLPGGDGAGAPDDQTIPDNTADLNAILKYKPSTSAFDEDGTEWAGGQTMEKEGKPGVAFWATYWSNATGTCGASAGYALGPGGAAGVTLEVSTKRGSFSISSSGATDGLQGATPVLTPKKPGLTMGGRGGYGGGGGSCASWAGAEKDPSEYTGNISVSAGNPGIGGLGGQGGPGGDGCIILYYSRPKEVKTGQVQGKNNRSILDRFGRRLIV